jgi:hypothetical protein
VWRSRRSALDQYGEAFAAYVAMGEFSEVVDDIEGAFAEAYPGSTTT